VPLYCKKSLYFLDFFDFYVVSSTLDASRDVMGAVVLWDKLIINCVVRGAATSGISSLDCNDKVQ